MFKCYFCLPGGDPEISQVYAFAHKLVLSAVMCRLKVGLAQIEKKYDRAERKGRKEGD